MIYQHIWIMAHEGHKVILSYDPREPTFICSLEQISGSLFLCVVCLLLVSTLHPPLRGPDGVSFPFFANVSLLCVVLFFLLSILQACYAAIHPKSPSGRLRVPADRS